MRLPRATAVTPPPGETGLVRADVGALTRTTTAEFRALERAGGVLQNVANLGFQAYMRRQEIDDIAEAGRATQHIQESWNQAGKTVATMDTSLDQPLPNDPAYHTSLLAVTKDKSIELRNELTKDIEKDAAKVFSGIRNAKTKARLIVQYNENYANNLKTLDGIITRRLHAYQLDTMQKLGEAAALNGDLKIADFYADKMAEHGLITPSAATNLKKVYDEIYKKSEIENIKPVLIDAVNASFGERFDGTLKGVGFLGELKMTDGSGRIATEISIGVNFDGKETQIPTLVPTLSQKEIDHLLSGKEPTKTIINKAIAHARKRIRDGESPFASTGGGKQAGLEVLDIMIDQLVKEGVLNKTEAAQANKVLGDWLDSYVEGRFKKAKDNRAAEIRQLYRDFSVMLLDSETAEQRYDIIDQSNIDDKEKWFGYIKGSYRDAPTISTPEGHDISYNAAYDAATLQVSPKEAYDILLEARFIDNSITDEQFKWAVDKIENPYPSHLVEDINSAVQKNLNNFNRVWSFDNERNKKVNESLLAWVDKLIEADKVPLFDFTNQMYAQSEKFRWGMDSGFSIGDQVEQGGVTWEVVGFDETGEPLMELLR